MLPIVGLLVGLAAPTLIAVGWQFVGVDGAAAIAIFGIPIGGLLGTMFSQGAVRTRSPWKFALKLGFIALVVPVGVLMLMPVSLLFVPFAAPVTIPAGAFVTGLIRCLAEMPPRWALVLSAGLVAASFSMLFSMGPLR